MRPDTQHAHHERIAVLDGLRALAIILVMLRHFMRPVLTGGTGTLPEQAGPLSAFLLNGWTGVDLFFILSGFLITGQLLRIRGAEIKRYFWRRFWRIAPVYYLVLTIVAAGAVPNMPASPETVWGWRYIYHLLFLQDYWPPDICVVFWSLAIEEKFYLTAPLLLAAVLAFKKQGHRYMALLCFIMLMPLLRLLTSYTLPEEMEYTTYFLNIRNQFHLCLDGLLAGMLCSLAWHHEKARAFLEKKHVATGFFIAGGLLALCLLAFIPPPDAGVLPLHKTLYTSLVTFAFAAMMMGLLGGAKGGGIFAARPWHGIALVSYSLYLVHMPVLQILPYITSGPFPHLKAACAYILLSGGLATLLYKTIEKPLIDWSRKKSFTTAAAARPGAGHR